MADSDVKRKGGRPKKREADDTPVKSVSKSPPKKAAVSNGDDAAVPAKRGRGRPPKPNAKHLKKPPPVPGRGRGRPPSKAAVQSKKKESSDEEEEEEEEEEEKKEESSAEGDSS